MNPIIVAHRGASRHAPENTLPAFQLAWQQQADAIECDVQLSRDGRLVCLHDADTQRVAAVKLLVRDSTLAELSALDVGSRHGPPDAAMKVTIPTLAQVLATVPRDKRIYIESKIGPAIVPPLLDALDHSGLRDEQIVILCFDPQVLAAVKAARPRYEANWLVIFQQQDGQPRQPDLDFVLRTLREVKADGLSAQFKLVDRAMVQQVRGAGFRFHAWTVDDAATARQLLDWGVSSITTNVPGELRSHLAG